MSTETKIKETMDTPTESSSGNEALRVAIAEKMGWQSLSNEGWPSLGFPKGETKKTNFPKVIPEYPTDAKAALSLVEHIGRLGWDFQHTKLADENHHEVTFANWTDEFTECAPTLPLAICLAFAKATGIDHQ